MHEHVTYLCVQENLANGWKVTFAFDESGAPRHCWSTDSLPDHWQGDRAWHQSGVSLLWLSEGRPSDPLSGVLRPGPQREMAAWLAKTYRYLRPILADDSTLLSRAELFEDKLAGILAQAPSQGLLLEIGGRSSAHGYLAHGKHRTLYLDPSASRAAPRKPGIAGPSDSVIEGIVEMLPLPDSSVQCIICLFVLEHLVEPRVALCEMSRVLKPGGHLLLGLPVDVHSEGSPPMFHRWRFTSGERSACGRTLVLREILLGEYGLINVMAQEWSAAAEADDARLYWFIRAPKS